MKMHDGYLDFDEYIVASEPHKREKVEAGKVAIGLQAVEWIQDNRRTITEGSPNHHRTSSRQV